MGRNLKKVAGILFISFYIIAAVQAAEEIKVEQIQAYMPFMTVYHKGDSTVQKALLDGEIVSIESQTLFSESETTLHYYIMLDCSSSVSEYFGEIRNGLYELAGETGEKTKLSLYLFGEGYERVLDGHESVQEAQSIISNLVCENSYTDVFSCVAGMGKDAADERDRKLQEGEAERQIGILITDGIDAKKTAGITMPEASKILSETGIPVYALGIAGVDEGSDALSSMGEFSRESGGDLFVFGHGEFAEIFQELQHELKEETWELKLKADGNSLGSRDRTLQIEFEENNEILFCSFRSEIYYPDEIAPEVIKAGRNSEQELYVEFSENVEGADRISAYEVNFEGKKLIPEQVQYYERTAVLYFSEPLYCGEYDISFLGITDCSQEKNLMVDSWNGTIDGAEAPRESRILEFISEWGWLLVVAVILVVILAAVYIVRKLLKRKALLILKDKKALNENSDYHKHVPVKGQEGRLIQLLVKNPEGNTICTELFLANCLYVGRSAECDISFEDNKMSRRHFSLERDGEYIFIEDLGTTNGTIVNGVRIHEKRKLWPGDKIIAGSLNMEIRW